MFAACQAHCTTRRGAKGVERNAVQEVEFWETAIRKADHDSAMNYVGCLLYNGAEE